MEFHCGLTLRESADLEGVQKRFFRILFLNLHYSEALATTGIERRERISREVFEAIKEPGHLLNHLLLMGDKNELHGTRILIK